MADKGEIKSKALPAMADQILAQKRHCARAAGA